jgi:ABC-2 type transport system ATP-binding protein
MPILKVQGLCKRYERFFLDHVSFTLDEGYIMGFIGSNGAGKTTTLKGIMNIIHTGGGTVEIFGEKRNGNEEKLKQDIAFMTGETGYFLKKKVKSISEVVRRFYSRWDDEAYESYLKRFDIDPEKKVEELSRGMRIKYALTLALSHRSRLMILDEPTTGLDPVARDDLLELFQELVEQGDRSILFSTHITSDLEKCADFITYIHNGKILESSSRDDLLDSYRIVSGNEEDLEAVRNRLIAHKKNSFGFSGLIKTEDMQEARNLESAKPTLDDIMIYYSKAEKTNE